MYRSLEVYYKRISLLVLDMMWFPGVGNLKIYATAFVMLL